MSEQSYIIRIYRCAQDVSGQHRLNGVVETPENGLREVFHDIQGLWNILARAKVPTRQGKHHPHGKTR